MLAALMLPAAAKAAEQPQFREQIEVARLLIDARVVDRSGNALLGLTVEDFRVLVDGQPATLEAVEWVAGDVPYAEGLPPKEAEAVGAPVVPRGKIVVFFVQPDFQSVRLTGLMRMAPRAVEIIDRLQPQDLVAVLAFDFHLKLHLDLTTDHEAARRAVQATQIFREPKVVVSSSPFSLFRHITHERALATTSSEEAIALTGEALEKLPGAKIFVLLGWGLGTLHGRSGVFMGPHYARARAALARARTSVLALDITDADYHDLEVGLEKAAEDTGGFYVKTHQFPDQAVARVTQALAGYYVLVVEKPPTYTGAHGITVELTRAKGEVLVRPVIVEQTTTTQR
ncbi:MAG: hypothetical protein V1750_01245 [Acidobacteriota bacterium]